MSSVNNVGIEVSDRVTNSGKFIRLRFYRHHGHTVELIILLQQNKLSPNRFDSKTTNVLKKTNGVENEKKMFLMLFTQWNLKVTNVVLFRYLYEIPDGMHN